MIGSLVERGRRAGQRERNEFSYQYFYWSDYQGGLYFIHRLHTSVRFIHQSHNIAQCIMEGREHEIEGQRAKDLLTIERRHHNRPRWSSPRRCSSAPQQCSS